MSLPDENLLRYCIRCGADSNPTDDFCQCGAHRETEVAIAAELTPNTISALQLLLGVVGVLAIGVSFIATFSPSTHTIVLVTGGIAVFLSAVARFSPLLISVLAICALGGGVIAFLSEAANATGSLPIHVVIGVAGPPFTLLAIVARSAFRARELRHKAQKLEKEHRRRRFVMPEKRHGGA